MCSSETDRALGMYEQKPIDEMLYRSERLDIALGKGGIERTSP